LKNTKKIPPNRTKGGWKTIIINNNIKSFDRGDSSNTIAQIRQRLFISGDLSKDSKSALYDKELAAGILKYKDRSGNNATTKILPDHIKDMNIPVGKRIKTIIVNMERCRWISNDIKIKRIDCHKYSCLSINIF
jgi:murein L,D-transpeptidase YcbB/YkuD